MNVVARFLIAGGRRDRWGGGSRRQLRANPCAPGASADARRAIGLVPTLRHGRACGALRSAAWSAGPRWGRRHLTRWSRLFYRTI